MTEPRLINAKSSNISLIKPTIDEVRSVLHEEFNNVALVNPGLDGFISDEGLVNGELKFTENGFVAFATFLGWNARTVLDQYDHDSDHITALLNNKMQKALDDDRLRFIAQGDRIEGVVTDSYGEIPTPDVLEHYISQNTGASIESLGIKGLNTRIIAMPANPVVISNEDRQVGDIMKVGHEVSNGMAGKMSCSYSLILLRLICLNGMIIADKGMTQRVKHVGSQALTRALNLVQNADLNIDKISGLIQSSQNQELQGRRLEFLNTKVQAKLGKKIADAVIEEYDVPRCRSRKGQPGNTHYDYWNSLTFTAKDEAFADKRRDTEKEAFKVLTLAPKLPVEDMPNRERVKRELLPSDIAEAQFLRLY